jgi:hypothetical protein
VITERPSELEDVNRNNKKGFLKYFMVRKFHFFETFNEMPTEENIVNTFYKVKGVKEKTKLKRRRKTQCTTTNS